MNFTKLSLASFVAAAAVMTGCPSDDTSETGTDTDNPTTMTGTNTMTGATMTMTDPTTTGMTMSGTDPDTTDTDPTGDTDTDTDTDTTGPDPNAFIFRDDGPEAYAQVDRMGFAAINTALIADKDMYNLGSPEDDAMGTYLDDIAASIDFLHIGNDMAGNGLEDDLAPLLPLLGDGSYEVCVPPDTFSDTCFGQVAPFAVPDVVLINTGAPAGFPNGRELEAPVIDIILAVLMLDVVDDAGMLSPAVGAFVDLDPETDGNQGLSQSGNDVDYAAEFPYLGAAQ